MGRLQTRDAAGLDCSIRHSAALNDVHTQRMGGASAVPRDRFVASGTFAAASCAFIRRPSTPISMPRWLSMRLYFSSFDGPSYRRSDKLCNATLLG